MKTHSDQKALLNRGGRPTLGDLLEKMEFRPADGSILLNGARMVLQRATVGADMQDQLVQRLGAHDAMVFLLRMGYRAGREDAEFIRQNWPNLEIGDAFTAGTRLHMLTGTVRVETLFNDFDFSTDRYASEFLWHDSVEAGEYQRRHGRAMAPVCWAQTGYATGYASEFFRKLVVFKEVHCAAMGHKSCRVVGKTVDGWGKEDPFVQVFMNEVLPSRAGVLTRAKTAPVPAAYPARGLAEKVVAPVRDALDLVVGSRLPALITGPAGSGRKIAAEWLHAQVFAGLGTLERRVATGPDIGETIERVGTSAERRRGQGQTLVIDGIEDLPAHLQDQLIRFLQADTEKGPVLLVGLSTQNPATLASNPRLDPALVHGLGVVPIALPALKDRVSDLPELAQCMLDQIAGAETRGQTLGDDAKEALCRARWPGNLPELRAVMHRAALRAQLGAPLSAGDISAALIQPPALNGENALDKIWALLEPAFEATDLTMDALNADLYRRVLERSGGNLSAAARLLGLSRAQLAYRLRSSAKPLNN